VNGHTRIAGGAGDDTVNVGSTGGLLDLLAATLVVDGGNGNDTLNVTDAGDLKHNLGWLTQTTLTGLGMAARTALDGLGRSLDLLYAVLPMAGQAHYTLELAYGAVTRSLTVDVGVTTAAQLATALQNLLYPLRPTDSFGRSTTCGLVGNTPCAPSVYVWEFGSGFLIGFRGEVNDPSDTRLVQLTATGAGFPIDGFRRTDGIAYTGVETLNLGLGSGDDVLNVRGTTAVTNVDLGAGDDRVYVSDQAYVLLGQQPDMLAGTLNDLSGTLNLQFGSGHHTLLVSDFSATVGDPNVLITDRLDAARARDGKLAATAEIAIVGLAPAGISYAASGGDWTGGVRIWTGYGNDTIVIDGTVFRSGQRTTTWLNTGLGDDRVTVRLLTGQDGQLILNTQGPDRSRPNASDDDYVDASGSTIPLVVFGGQGNDTIITGTSDDIVLGDNGLVLWFAPDAVPDFSGLADGVLTAAELAALIAAAVGVAGYGGPGDFSLNTETLVGLVIGLPVAGDGHDTIITGDGDDIVVGGGGADDIATGDGHDVVIGDLGYAAYQWSAGRLVRRQVAATHVTVGGADAITTGAGDDLVVGGAGADTIDAGEGANVVLGDSGSIVTGHLAGVLVSLVVTAFAGGAGNDSIVTGSGNDVVVAGEGADTVTAGNGANVVLGDLGTVQLTWSSGQLVLLAVESLLVGQGAEDRITTGAGDDVVVGGAGADTVDAGEGANVVLGDSGSVIIQYVAGLPVSLVVTAYAGGAGNDSIVTGSGNDVVVAGEGADNVTAGNGANIVLGDLGTVR
ncbi:MAG: hypothetical protein KIT69_15695, partial [Propionibacteriaceae bacterium]|nr:hypothetical protein [Propionibacteriaceae bacterium]